MLYPDFLCLPRIKAGYVSILKKIDTDRTIKPLHCFVENIKQGDFNLGTHRDFFSTSPRRCAFCVGGM